MLFNKFIHKLVVACTLIFCLSQSVILSALSEECAAEPLLQAEDTQKIEQMLHELVISKSPFTKKQVIAELAFNVVSIASTLGVSSLVAKLVAKQLRKKSKESSNIIDFDKHKNKINLLILPFALSCVYVLGRYISNPYLDTTKKLRQVKNEIKKLEESDSLCLEKLEKELTLAEINLLKQKKSILLQALQSRIPFTQSLLYVIREALKQTAKFKDPYIFGAANLISEAVWSVIVKSALLALDQKRNDEWFKLIDEIRSELKNK